MKAAQLKTNQFLRTCHQKERLWRDFCENIADCSQTSKCTDVNSEIEKDVMRSVEAQIENNMAILLDWTKKQ